MAFETISETAIDVTKSIIVSSFTAGLVATCVTGWPAVVGTAIITMGIEAGADTITKVVTNKKDATFTEIISDKIVDGAEGLLDGARKISNKVDKTVYGAVSGWLGMA